MCWLHGGAKDVIAGQTPKMKGMDLDEAQASVELLAEEFAISKAKMQVGPVGGPARAPSLSLAANGSTAAVRNPLFPSPISNPPTTTPALNGIRKRHSSDRVARSTAF